MKYYLLAFLLSLMAIAASSSEPAARTESAKTFTLKADYSKELAQLEEAKNVLKEVRAVWWGYDKEDATKCLQAALNSGARRVFVDNVGSDWLTGPLAVPSDIEVIFEDGVVIRAKDELFRPVLSRLFSIVQRKNVTMRGIGKVTFIMNKELYLKDQATYTPSGQRHAIYINDSENVCVSNITTLQAGGDGLYVGSVAGSKNIRIERVVCDGNGRQGISVTGVNGLSVKDSKFNNSWGGGPQCGVDIEPNPENGGIRNVLFENCDFENNRMFGVIIGVGCVRATDPPIGITFKNCRMIGPDAIRVLTTGQDHPKPGRIEFIDCAVKGHVGITGHLNKNAKILFRNITIDNREGKEEAFDISSGLPNDLYNIEIDKLTVTDDVEREPLKFVSRFANALVDPMLKDIVTVNSKGEKKVFDTVKFIRESAPDPLAKSFMSAELDLSKLKPASEKGKAAGTNIQFREKTEYYVYARTGDTVKVNFKFIAIHKYVDTRAPIAITLSSPSGKLISSTMLKYETSEDISFKAEEEGIYHFSFDSGGQCVGVTNDSAGQAFGYGNGYLSIFACSGQLFFAVPAGVKRVQIDAGGSGRGGESTIYLLDQEGKTRAEAIKIAGNKILTVEREDYTKAEVWSVKFNAVKLFLRLGDPIPPLFSTDPANLLVSDR